MALNGKPQEIAEDSTTNKVKEIPEVSLHHCVSSSVYLGADSKGKKTSEVHAAVPDFPID